MATTNPFDVPTLEGPAGMLALRDLWARNMGVYALDDGATITLDLANPERAFSVTLAGDRMLAFTGGTEDLDMKQIIVRVREDVAGGHTLTPGAGARLGTDNPTLTLVTTPSKTNYLCFLYDHLYGVADFIGYSRGF